MNQKLSQHALYHATLSSKIPDTILDIDLNIDTSYYTNGYISNECLIIPSSGKKIYINDIISIMQKESISHTELKELHSFSWLYYAIIASDTNLRHLVRNTVQCWIDSFKSTSSIAWNVYIVAERLFNWILNYKLIKKKSDSEFNLLFLKSIAKQICFLKRFLYMQHLPKNNLLIIKTLLYYSYITSNRKYLIKIVKILNEFISKIDFFKGALTTYDLLIIYKHLLDIRFLLNIANLEISTHLKDQLVILFSVIKYIRHNDGGISLFGSKITPQPQHIDKMLAYIDTQPINCSNYGYIKSNHIDNIIIIDKYNPFFSFEFSGKSKRIIMESHYAINTDVNVNVNTDLDKADVNVHTEKGNFWFEGISEKHFNNGTYIKFYRKLYVNNIGNDLRCEDSISSCFSSKQIYVIDGRAKITEQEYQNGFFVDLENGERWSWNFSKNMQFSFEQGKIRLFNGEHIKTTNVILTTNCENNNTRWVLKLH